MALQPTDLILFGGVSVPSSAGAVPLTGAERRLLASLSLTRRTGTSEARLIELVWHGREPPATAKQSLQNHVSRLRSKMNATWILREPDGYRLNPSVTTDVDAFERAVHAARDAREDARWDLVAKVTDDITTLAAGPAFEELGDDRVASALRTRQQHELDEMADLGVRAMIELGDLDEAIGAARSLLHLDSSRERRWCLLMTALERNGRRAEALGTYHQARRRLIDDHGVEPGAELRQLHASLLERSAGDPAGWSSTLVGRGEDLRGITASLRSARTVVVTGPAGIGKSTLLRMIARSWDGPTITLDCTQNPWMALGPVHDLMDHLHGTLDALGLPTDPADTRDHNVDGAWQQFRRPTGMPARTALAISTALSSMTGILVLIDDLDRTGPTTRRILLDALSLSQTPTVITGRDADARLRTMADVVHHELGGLDPGDLTELVDTEGRDDLPESARVARWLHDQTGGHPMYARQLLSTTQPEHWSSTRSQDNPTGAELGDTLVQLLQSRLEALPATCRDLLDAAAVMNDPLDLEVLRSLADVGRLQPLLDARVLVRTTGDAVRFTHSLFQVVAYDRIPHGRRLELHHAIGNASTRPESRAHHLVRAAELDPAAAAAASATAARAAFSAQAYVDASNWFATAARLQGEAGRRDSAVLEFELEAADCARLAGEPGHAEPLLDLAERALISGSVDLRRRATVAAVQLGEAVDPGPQQERAVALATRAVQVEDDPVWAARLSATSSILHSMAGDPDQCRQMFMTAFEIHAEQDDAFRCDVLPYAYMALGHPDDLARRTEAMTALRRAAIARTDPIAEWEAAHLAFTVALMNADGPALRHAHAEAARLLTFSDNAGRQWSVAYQGAALAALEEDHETADVLAQRALEIGAGVAPGRALSAYSGQLLALRWAQDRLAELSPIIRQIIADQPEIPAWKAAGSLIVAADDPPQSRVWFDELLTDDLAGLPRDFAWLAGTLLLGAAAAKLADPVRAARILPFLAPYETLVCWQGTCSYGPVAAVLADLAAVMDDPRSTGWRALAQDLNDQLRSG